MSVLLRAVSETDYESVWQMFHQVVRAGEYYAFDPDTCREEAIDIWINQVSTCFVLEEAGQIMGSYFIKKNQPGLGAHVCNAGYMVDARAQGKGYATLMCEHSQQQACRLGYQAMQFNFVVSSNANAVYLWQKLGFNIVGTVPEAFRHKRLGLVDIYIMHKFLSVQ